MCALDTKYDSIPLPSPEGISGIYIGSDIWFLSRMQAFDRTNVHIIHCYTCDEALAQITNEALAPDLIMAEFDIAEQLSHLRESPAFFENDLLRPVFLLLSNNPLSDADSQDIINLQIDDVLLKSSETEPLFERICYLTLKSRRHSAIIRPRTINNIRSLNKRGFDILCSTIALVTLMPIILMVGLLNKILFNKPAYTSIRRVGTGYKLFNLHRFVLDDSIDTSLNPIHDCNKRHNYTYNLDDHSCSICEQLCRPCSPILIIDDQQICESRFIAMRDLVSYGEKRGLSLQIRPKFQNFIAKSYINRIPEFFNVLKGDLSIVGNKVLSPDAAEKLTTDEDTIRFLAPCGLISLRNSYGDEGRQELDNLYAKSNSFRGDLKIIFRVLSSSIKPA